MNRDSARGLYAATTTPFLPDGTINEALIKSQTDYLIASGINGLVPIGGTGEASALSFKERVQVLSATVEAADGRIPVIAGITVPGLADAIALGRECLRSGADALMVLTPYGVAASQAGIREYYKALSQAVGQPVLLYDIPYMTMVTTLPQTVRQIVDDGSIFAMKASNPDQALFAELMGTVGKDIAVFSGDEDYFAAEVAMGAVGGILASCTVLPRTWLEIFRLAREGNVSAAEERLARLGDFVTTVYSEPNPGPLKAALRIAGFDVGSARIPMIDPGESLVQKLDQQLAHLLDYERKLYR